MATKEKFIMSLLLTQNPIMWSAVFIAFMCGYLSGSVPYGLLLGKISGLGDIRESGSGNIGATNVLRVGGKKLAALTLLLDGLKGFFPVLIAAHLHKDYAVMAALGAFTGHLFPIWLSFRGGKGVAVALGIVFALSWKAGLVLCMIWLVTAAISRYSSLSALAAFSVAPFVTAWFSNNFQFLLVMMIISIAVWVRHHENIRRLINDTESKINFSKKP